MNRPADWNAGAGSVGLVRQLTDDRVGVACPSSDGFESSTAHFFFRDKMYYTYVLYSPRFNKIYVGFSGDTRTRLLIHNDLRNTGWTSRYQPWELFYTEEFATKAEAMKRERQLKTSAGRTFIWTMINNRPVEPAS